MKIEIDFPFWGYTKGDLIKYLFDENSNVDSAIPMEYNKHLYELSGDRNAHFWYVMDYTDNKAFGKLVNLKEKFFDKVAEQCMQKLPKTLADLNRLKQKRA